MANLDPRIETIREKYGLSSSDFWELPQKKGTWLVKHAALEVAAAKADIQFDNPIIVEANSEAGVAVLSVAGSLGERREWATGEASPKNNKNSYPWAMAEKRAKDRVILKLIGMHGLVYSEDEMDQSVATVEASVPRLSSYRAKMILDVPGMQKQIREAKTLEILANWQNFFEVEAAAWFPAKWAEPFLGLIDERRKALNGNTDAAFNAYEASATDEREPVQ